MAKPPMSQTGPRQKERMTLRRAAGSAASAAIQPPWAVLVVDDEPDVHAMTRLLLRDLRYKDRPFEVVSAMSAAEARRILAERPDIPVTLLDVVMETPDAGLALARYIREDLGNSKIAIVLRTGQPGDAPEREVMLAYDINDYRGKTELTAQKLFTALVGGLRSWSNLSAIETLNASLERRVEERTRELQQARRFAETLVDMLPHPVWYKDGAGRPRIINQAFRETFHLEPGVMAIPAQLEELDRGSDAVVTAEGGGAVAFEAAIDLPWGQRTLMISKGSIAAEDGGPPGSVGVITDITERKRMERQLRLLATVDDLTQTLNRRAFFAAAETEVERSARYGNSISVVMFDLDHFKRVNDTHGHAVGDAALKAAAAALKDNLREVDILGRLGGEEFAILLPETPLAGALEVAERLRQAVAAIRVPLGGDKGELRLTASLGVAERGPGEIAVDRVLARADAALYRSKEQGRDRVSG